MKNPLTAILAIVLIYGICMAWSIMLVQSQLRIMQENGTNPARVLGNGVGQFWGEFTRGVDDTK